MSYKNINLTIEDVKKIIEERLKPLNGGLNVERKSGNLFQFSITIPGQDKALINIYQTKKGLTLSHEVGSNPHLSKEIAKFIASKAEKVESITHSLKGIHEDLFNEFLDALEELDIKITVVKEGKEGKLFKAENLYGHLLTLNYYPSTGTLLIQGHSTKLFKDVILWFLDKTIENPEEIVKIIFKTTKDFSKYEITFPDELVDKGLERNIGSHYYNENFIKETERKWLKVSYYLLKFERDMPDYYPSISASLKVIEGILNRIILTHCGWTAFHRRSKAILIFEFDDNSDEWRLKKAYQSNFRNRTQIALIEDFYKFYKKVRNKYSHNFILPEHSALSDLEEAEQIFLEVQKLLKRLPEAFPQGIRR